MKIAEVAPPWLSVPPRGYGGIELVVSLLADGLSDRGHRVTLFATGDSSTRARLEFAFPEAPGPAEIESPWRDCVQSLLAFGRSSEFDVLHSHSRFSAVVAGALVEAPVVHTIHSDLSPEMRALYSLVGDRMWFVAVSHAQRSTMPDLNYAAVVHNGIDVDQYPYRADKEDFLLFLGRSAPEKGLLRAVEAARSADRRIVVAVKIAEKRERDHWQREVVPILPVDAVVVEEIDRESKVDLLSRARALLFPIDWDEPFGLVMAEAMACGTPVLATPRGAAPEVVADGETGFLLSVEAFAEEAAEALGRLDGIDPADCRRRVEERFSKKSMVDGYEAVFREVAG
jgi:glycosyltransferase involved in cell wall biosynthesis